MRKDEEDGTSFKKALLNSIDKNIPSKYVSRRDKLPWLSSHLRRLIRRKNCLHAKFKKTGSARLRHNWRMIRKTLSLGFCQARYDYINDIIGDVRSNPKPFAAQRKDSQSMPPLQTQQDLLAESDLDKASSLNQQFCQNFSSEDTESRS